MKNQEVRITLEGGSGSGKQAIAMMIGEALREAGIRGFAMGGILNSENFAVQDEQFLGPDRREELLGFLNESVFVQIDVRPSLPTKGNAAAFLAERLLEQESAEKVQVLAQISHLTRNQPEIYSAAAAAAAKSKPHAWEQQEEIMRQWWNKGNSIFPQHKEDMTARGLDLFRVGTAVVLASVADRKVIAIAMFEFDTHTALIEKIVVRSYSASLLTKHRHPGVTFYIAGASISSGQNVLAALHEEVMAIPIPGAAEKEEHRKQEEYRSAAVQKADETAAIITRRAAMIFQSTVLPGQLYSMNISDTNCKWDIRSPTGCEYTRIEMSVDIQVSPEDIGDITGATVTFQLTYSDKREFGGDTQMTSQFIVPPGFAQNIKGRPEHSPEVMFSRKTMANYRNLIAGRYLVV